MAGGAVDAQALVDSRPSIPALDVAINDVCSRLSYETVSNAVAEQVAAWKREHLLPEEQDETP